MERAVRIYAWLCPETGSVVYIGKTSMSISRRMANHYGDARRHPKTKKEIWLADVLSRGLDPTVEILEETTVEASSDAEKRWAATFLLVAPLLNNARVGGGNPGVGRVVWTPEALSLLGKAGDRKIAKMLGCERKTVSYKRECLGIPAAMDRADNVPPPPRGGWNRVVVPDHIIGLLGEEPDYVLAARMGVDKQVVARARKQRGIEDYASRTGNNGQMKVGRPHPRWIKRADQRANSPLEATNLVSDDLWTIVDPLFPPNPKHGKLDYDNRAILRGVLWVLRSGIKWHDLPASLQSGHGSAVFRRLRNWEKSGHWEEIKAALLKHLPDSKVYDWSRVTFRKYKSRSIDGPHLNEQPTC